MYLFFACASPPLDRAGVLPPTPAAPDGDAGQREVLIGWTWGLPPGTPFEVSGCGGRAITGRSGGWAMSVAADAVPCDVALIVEGEHRGATYVEQVYGVVHLPLDQAALGVRVLDQGDRARVDQSLRLDGLLLPGDIILEADGVPWNRAGDALAAHRPGDAIRVRVLRNGRESAVTVPLIEIRTGPGFTTLDPDLERFRPIAVEAIAGTVVR